jgi:hypothetical protein
MKITKRQLRKIIKEEFGAINEANRLSPEARAKHVEDFRGGGIGALIAKGKMSATWNPEKYIEVYISKVRDYQFGGSRDSYELAMAVVEEKFLEDLLSDNPAAFSAPWDLPLDDDDDDADPIDNSIRYRLMNDDEGNEVKVQVAGPPVKGVMQVEDTPPSWS